MTTSWTRTDLSLNRPSVKTDADYGNGGGLSTRPVHAPDFMTRYKALANSIEVPPEITDPMERALFKWQALEDMRDDLLIDDEGPDGDARHALNHEAWIRADRPPEAAPLPTEEQRMGLARMHLDRTALDPEDAAAIAALDKE